MGRRPGNLFTLAATQVYEAQAVTVRSPTGFPTNPSLVKVILRDQEGQQTGVEERNDKLQMTRPDPLAHQRGLVTT